MVTNLNTGKADYLPVPRQDRESLLLQATCAMPLLFPIYRINGQPYLDGGAADSIRGKGPWIRDVSVSLWCLPAPENTGVSRIK